ncbi:NUDIX domain-containing protein [Salinibacter grassmerensis]|uniref:NUDIX domain-containing protein n=1 Tax=Salinibacter grassmerensis TaxID=3040353 RepID=UPI0021E77E71|nr:NUDIX domain-containing protein [Salinibacter grassmerensis]
MPTVHLLARAVFREANHVLVVQAEGQPHTFLPGGHREPGEGLEGCLRREIDEELGVRAEVGRYLGAVEHQWMREGERQYEINHCYAAASSALTVDTSPKAQEGYLSFAWAPVNQLDRISLQPPPLRVLLAGPDEGGAPWWASTVR